MLEQLTIVGALGSAVIGGLLFAFSTSVMRALGKLPPAQGAAAMQWINVLILNPLFLTIFVGTAVICATVAGLAALQWNGAASAWRLAGALLYVVGTVGVTMACNVPRNNQLAGVTADSPEGERVWACYLPEWTLWNHVRTLAAVAAAALFMLSL